MNVPLFPPRAIDHRLDPSPEFPFFLMDGIGGEVTYYRTEADRDRAAEDLIFSHGHEGPWDHEVMRDIIAGEVTQVCVRRGVRMPDPSEAEEAPDIRYYCMYEMHPLGAEHEPEPRQAAGINRDKGEGR